MVELARENTARKERSTSFVITHLGLAGYAFGIQ
jgi:hypothetical protein